jgi:hypothetical protein
MAVFNFNSRQAQIALEADAPLIAQTAAFKGKRHLGNLFMCEDNIKLYVKEIGCEGVNWIELAWDKTQWQAFVNTLINVWVQPLKEDSVPWSWVCYIIT